MTVPAAHGFAPSPCEALGGCAEYAVAVTGLCSSATLLAVTDPADVRWTRVLDDASTASVTLSVDGLPASERDVYGTVRAWVHELHIFRCGQEVWSGPVVNVAYTAGTVTLSARDNSVWFDRLAVEAKIDRKAVDLALVAEDLVRGAIDLGREAGCLLMETTMTGVLEDRVIEKHSGYVGDALRELARGGLSYTCLGRRLLLFGTRPLALIGPLSDDDFTDELEVQEDGLDGCTRAVVVGEGVTGTYEVAAPVRVTKLVRDTTLSTQAQVDLVALRLVQGGYPWPVHVSPPGSGGGTLTATAGVCIDDLVPGVAVRTFAASTARQFVTDLQLTSVNVQAGPDSESVQVTLSPPAPVAA